MAVQGVNPGLSKLEKGDTFADGFKKGMADKDYKGSRASLEKALSNQQSVQKKA